MRPVLQERASGPCRRDGGVGVKEARLGGGVWIVLPSLSAFVPLFSCIAVSQSHSPGTRRRCRLAGALSESSVRGSRGEESRGEAPTSRSWDRAPLTARA